jgi:hypothetical protein
MLVLPKFSTFGSQKCYLRRRIWSKTPAGRSQKCYFGEGIGHFRAQKSAIFGETFTGASRGLYNRPTNATMNSSYPVLQSRPIVPHITSSCSQCHSPLEFPVPAPTPRPATLLQVRCFKCQSTISHTFYPTQIPGGGANGSTSSSSANGSNTRSPPSQAARKGRKIGTQDRPLETGYYDILGCSGEYNLVCQNLERILSARSLIAAVDATTEEIKKAYRT